MSIIKKLVASFVGLNPAGPRSAMKLLSVLLAFILGATLWVGPTAAAEKKYVTDPSTGKVVTAPEYGGTLTFATMLEPPHGDPNLTLSAGLVISGVAEKLGIANWAIDRDEYALSSKYIPVEVAAGELAESWDISPDGLTYTFHIRKGVHWHNKAPMNGRELTAKDIEYNLHRYLGLGSGFTEPSEWATYLKVIKWESITATDKYTVVMKLKEPFLAALHRIMVAGAFVLPPEVIKQHGDLQDWRNLVGTGPYELTDWVEGSSFTHTKIPDYWGFDEKYPQNRLPYIDKLVGLFIKEEATRIAGLRSGRIDFLGYPAGLSDIKSVDVLDSLRKTNPEIELFPWWDRSETVWGLDASKPPFDDIRVRRAMQMALDLETINLTYFKGTANWQPQGRIGEGMKGYYTPFDEWPEEVKKGYMYDPEGAEALLDEADYPRDADGIRFKTVLNHWGENPMGYTEITAEYWKAIGIDIEILDLGRDQYMAQFLEGAMEGMMATVGGSNAIAGVVGMLRWQAHSTAVWNVPKFKDAEVDALIEAAESATSIAEEQRPSREADMLIIEQQRYVWGPKAGKYIAIQPWVEGYNGELYFGWSHRLPIFARLWIDSELKEAMGH